ncbi:tRNA pseudouridine(13) synthase TruD [Ectothiorhodospiraceae bacterium 2226]|nr:tRNA pseudouridine(13) synthase TruD [Ectothiorhodospiraceae bacterium 2226]
MAELAARLAGPFPPDPYAYGGPRVRGRVRARPEHFQVDEEPLEPPLGEGQHLWVQVRKRGANTEWVARQLAQAAGVPPLDVGYAGLKDRHAVTTQWFSIDLAGRDPDPAGLAGEDYEVLAVGRHPRKLRRGELAGNRFTLQLTDLAGDLDALETLLPVLGEQGVPNYFGPQRFGRGGDNLRRAALMLAGELRPPRHQRGLYLSAARSFLFNQVLGARVAADTWRTALAGEAPFYGGQGYRRGPSGPLWGRGRSPVFGAAAQVERDALAPYAALCEALEHVGLKQERRALALPVADLAWQRTEEGWQLSFWLPAGAYATSVLRELVELVDQPAAEDTSAA